MPRLLKLLLKASGKLGVPQGGVISPFLSNVYLNEVDKMLERAKEVTRQGRRMRVVYPGFADDLVVLVDAHPREARLRKAGEKQLQGQLAKLQVEVNEEKNRRVDLQHRENLAFLGSEFRRIRSRRGRWMPLCTPRGKKRTALLRKLKGVSRSYRSQPAKELIERINSHSSRLGEILCGRPLEPVFLQYPRLGREEDSAPLGRSLSTPRLRMEAMEQGMAVWHARALELVWRGSSTALLGGRSTPIGSITLAVKCTRTRSARNSLATCDVAGAGNGAWGNPRPTGPVPDPTDC